VSAIAGAGKVFCQGNPEVCGEFNCEDYIYPWDPAVHIAHSPPNLVVETSTGVVRWETGLNPFETDTAPYMENRLDENGDVIALAGTVPAPLKVRHPTQLSSNRVVF
jgi:hypothetical protein